MVSDFESGKPVSRYGAGWSVFDDNEVGGESSAEISVIKEGAHRSKYSLLVKGYIEDDISGPAAGAMFSPGKSLMAPMDLSSKKRILFWARGGRIGQTCQLAIFSRSNGNEMAKRRFRAGPEWKKYSKTDIPSFMTFVADPEWRKYKFLFSQFPGVDQHQVTGILFSGGPSPGPFGFEIDDVQIR
jgi:hypothetical protein